jgi:DNA topoisomerase IB
MVRGVYRIGAMDFSVYLISGKSCKKCSMKFPEAVRVAKLFKKHGNLDMIIDKKVPKFLSGGYCGGRPVGTKIKVLPNSQYLNKVYSLFSPGLIIHDEKSNIHWDVIYQNPNGSYAYLYTSKKESSARKEKYEKVREFGKCLPKLRKNLGKVLGEDILALPMLILLKTKMRIGNEMYYRKNHHKGLTTLKKKDIIIKGNSVSLDFIGKDGVPQKIEENFPRKIIVKLKSVLKLKNPGNFVFVDLAGHPLKDIAFERAFEKYCGVKFYPHIVRSYYATAEAEKFLKRKKASGDEVKKFYMRIANKLGHKRFSKKTGSWEDSYQVTLHHYIRPELVEKIAKLSGA